MGRYALVLAAGKGTRFQSGTPKVLQPLAGRPLICHQLDKLQSLLLDAVFVVVGHGAAEVRQAIAGYEVETIEQLEQRGTGHAVQVAAAALEGLQGSLLVVYGDSVLVREAELTALLERREESGAAAVLLTTSLDDPTGYGRIVRDSDSQLAEIVEERDAIEDQRAIKEVNSGFYCFDVTPLLAALSSLTSDNVAGEYYLTDIPGLLLEAGQRVETISVQDSTTLAGVNDQSQLAEAERHLKTMTNHALLESGVKLIDPQSSYVDPRAVIGAETVIFPNVCIEGRCEIGPGCTIRSGAQLSSATLEPGVLIDQGSIVRESRVGSGTTVGPYAHLRGGCEVGAGVRIGNFVEVKQSVIGDGSKAAHLSYLGNAVIGTGVNIGAGTITCNYDGASKNTTVIEDGVFIGSNTQLIAPVRIGRNAYVAAGSTVTEDVPPESLAIARSRQVNKKGWKKGD